jgi:hypothetical protein
LGHGLSQCGRFGPIERHAPGEWYCGGLWVLEVENRDEAVVTASA